jgi:hypothetical protein
MLVAADLVDDFLQEGLVMVGRRRLRVGPAKIVLEETLGA